MALFTNNKGQGAMEYLTTYGWALLVVVVVGLVLWQAGVFNTQSEIRFSDWELLKPLAPGVAYSPTGTFQAAFLNVLGSPIEILNVSMTEENSGTSCTGPIYVNEVNQMPGNATIPAGDGFKVSTTTCPQKPEGSPYSMTLTIEYYVVTAPHTVYHIESGIIDGTVEG